MTEPTVLNLCGLPGTGKTYFLNMFNEANPGSIHRMSPTSMGEPFFPPAAAVWNAYAAIALDEVTTWERESVIAGVMLLEQEALLRGKKLILVTQREHDLLNVWIKLTTSPMVVEMKGRQDVIKLSFNGQTLNFVKPIFGITKKMRDL